MSKIPKIFVSMAAQDDDEIKYAIAHAFKNAKYPENVFVGVGLTCMNKKYFKEIKNIAKNNSNVRFNYVKQKKNKIDTLGIGQGRLRAASLYDDEDYMLQIDCHSYLDKDWDVKLVSYFKEAKKEVKKDNFVISCIPPIYGYDKKDKVIKIESPKTRYGTYIADSFFIGVVPQWKEVDISLYSNKKFIPAHKLNPACVFGNKEFAKDPSICKEAIFYDEDWTQQISLFHKNFSFVFPNFEDFPVRHLDGDHMTSGHERTFITDYVSNNKSIELHENLKNNYLNFIKNPKNKEAINRYRTYSKADAKFGYVSYSNYFIPKEF